MGQLAWLNQMQLQQLCLVLSVHEAGPWVEASAVNNGGVGAHLRAAAFRYIAALALIVPHL